MSWLARTVHRRQVLLGLRCACVCVAQALDMLSAGHSQWRSFNTKRQQVQQLMQQQQQVVAAALGCSLAAAEALLAAGSAGQHLQPRLKGFVSTSTRPDTADAAAAMALSHAGSVALEDAAESQQLTGLSENVAKELTFWEDGVALHAWLLLRAGKLDKAAAAAQEQPNKHFAQQHQQQNTGQTRQQDPAPLWGWRWWVLAQVKWQAGDVVAVQKLLQQGQEQLQREAQPHAAGHMDAAGVQVWRVLLPSLQELSELQEDTQQLLSLKEAGNAAIQSKQYDKAAEEYTKALALQPSCGFAAVIHSNRAAAYQQQGRLVEALADCSRAVALDPRYARAYLRCAVTSGGSSQSCGARLCRAATC